MNEKKNVISKIFGILFSLVLVISSIYCLYQLIQLNVLTSKLLLLVTIINNFNRHNFCIITMFH